MLAGMLVSFDLAQAIWALPFHRAMPNPDKQPERKEASQGAWTRCAVSLRSTRLIPGRSSGSSAKTIIETASCVDGPVLQEIFS